MIYKTWQSSIQNFKDYIEKMVINYLKFYNLFIKVIKFIFNIDIQIKLNCEKSLPVLQNVFSDSLWVKKTVPMI